MHFPKNVRRVPGRSAQVIYNVRSALGTCLCSRLLFNRGIGNYSHLVDAKCTKVFGGNTHSPKTIYIDLEKAVGGVGEKTGIER